MPGRPYALSEKRQILRYIVNKNSYYELKGNAFWKLMENDIPERSWQSLKDHFKKQLYPNLHNPTLGLTKEEKELLREGYQYSSAVPGAKKNVRKKENTLQPLEAVNKTLAKASVQNVNMTESEPNNDVKTLRKEQDIHTSDDIGVAACGVVIKNGPGDAEYDEILSVKSINPNIVDSMPDIGLTDTFANLPNQDLDITNDADVIYCSLEDIRKPDRIVSNSIKCVQNKMNHRYKNAMLDANLIDKDYDNGERMRKFREIEKEEPSSRTSNHIRNYFDNRYLRNDDSLASATKMNATIKDSVAFELSSCTENECSTTIDRILDSSYED